MLQGFLKLKILNYKTWTLKKTNCIKNEHIKNEWIKTEPYKQWTYKLWIIKNQHIKNERIKNELIKKRTDPDFSSFWRQNIQFLFGLQVYKALEVSTMFFFLSVLIEWSMKKGITTINHNCSYNWCIIDT